MRDRILRRALSEEVDGVGTVMRYVILTGCIVVALLATVAAQYPSRLQMHGRVDIPLTSLGGYDVQVLAVCDTGNGTMIYIVREAARENNVTAVANGCSKVQVER